jgi:hypothetical protein
LAAKLDAEEHNTLVEGELDARPMGIGKGPTPPCYNVQTAVDADTRRAFAPAARASRDAPPQSVALSVAICTRTRGPNERPFPG